MWPIHISSKYEKNLKSYYNFYNKIQLNQVFFVLKLLFRDFLKRCSDYGICGNEWTGHLNENVGGQPNENKLEMLTKQVLQRNQKIQKFRQKKELEEQINIMKLTMKKEHVDDDTKREFYIKLLKISIIDAQEELSSIAQEIEILKFQQNRADSGEYHDQKPSKNLRPLKPIIITRDLAQKTVYGMGYPSMPTMTVSEFYDQRVREGIFPDPCKSNIKPNLDESQKQQQTQEEREDIEKEEKLEQDDDYELARLRAKDDYKDEHRRGEGNRHNRS